MLFNFVKEIKINTHFHSIYNFLFLACLLHLGVGMLKRVS